MKQQAERVDIKSILMGKVTLDTRILICGWVRTRRDSKAGISFIQVHDGSSFDPLQVVVPSDLENYESEVKKTSSGCSVKVSGLLVKSEGKGQSYEIQVDSFEVLGWVDDPELSYCKEKTHI